MPDLARPRSTRRRPPRAQRVRLLPRRRRRGVDARGEPPAWDAGPAAAARPARRVGRVDGDDRARRGRRDAGAGRSHGLPRARVAAGRVGDRRRARRGRLAHDAVDVLDADPRAGRRGGAGCAAVVPDVRLPRPRRVSVDLARRAAAAGYPRSSSPSTSPCSATGGATSATGSRCRRRSSSAHMPGDTPRRRARRRGRRRRLEARPPTCSEVRRGSDLRRHRVAARGQRPAGGREGRAARRRRDGVPRRRGGGGLGVQPRRPPARRRDADGRGAAAGRGRGRRSRRGLRRRRGAHRHRRAACPRPRRTRGLPRPPGGLRPRDRRPAGVEAVLRAYTDELARAMALCGARYGRLGRALATSDPPRLGR